MRSLVLLLPFVLGIGQPPAPVACGDLMPPQIIFPDHCFS